MGCLYCGKQIGPFRLLRDSEFCSSVHRKSYGARLGRALGQIGAPEAAPAGIAHFQPDFPIQGGNNRSAAERGYWNRSLGELRFVKSWLVIASYTPETRFLLAPYSIGGAPGGGGLSPWLPRSPQMATPRVALVACPPLFQTPQPPPPLLGAGYFRRIAPRPP